MKQDRELGGLSLTPAAWDLFRGAKAFEGHLDMPTEPEAKPTGQPREDGDLDYDRQLFELLRQKRKELADEARNPPYVVFSDRTVPRAFEFDPMGRREPVSGTLRTAARRLEAVSRMGFDVVYLPPVHPIGTTFRKGRNNTLEAKAGDPGSPWAIGAAEGGHDAIHRTWGRSLISRRSCPGPGTSASRSRSTWRCRRRPTTRR